MKLLCDVCENAVASLICCADEAALCLPCDSRVHAANKLAGKHHRMQLLSEASEPAVCDICQERPSFFFCIEDRALLCRECDVSIHSANALAAKHRRFLLTGIQVGVSSSSSPSQDTTSAISLEQHIPDTSPLNSTAVAVKKSCKQDVTTAAVNCSNNNESSCDLGEMSNRAAKRLCKQAMKTTTINCDKESGGNGSKEAPEKASKASAPAAMSVKALRSYLMSKQGIFSMPSNIDSTDHKKEAMDNSSSNSTTISIQRISAGRVPFVAPVLSTLRTALMHEEAFNNINNHKVSGDNMKGNISDIINKNSNNDAMMNVEDCPPIQISNVSDYLMSGIPGWRLDELLTDLVGVCESGPPLSPPKESNAPGFGTQEDPPWYAELDSMEENDLSPSQEEGMALVPEMPSPPTASGLVTSCGKQTCPATQPWAFDYLFTDTHHSNEFSVVPDIDGRRSSPLSTASPTRDSISKKRKFWLDV